MKSTLWKWMRWFLFHLEAETAHRITVSLIRIGILLRNAPLKSVSALSIQESGKISSESPALPRVFGLEFQSRVGLAAGFDKNCEILEGLPDLGFGFAEIGTVTPRPQDGNTSPRIFRDVAAGALFNRMGFPNRGAKVISRRLERAKKKLPPTFRVGVNLGKNKDSVNEKIAADYAEVARAFEGLADFLVINVSSPNTPGLRSLQTAEALKPIVGEVVEVISKWKNQPPLLLKLAPEVTGTDLIQLIQTVEPMGVDGWVLTNTLGGFYDVGDQRLPGGWSGKPLSLLSKKSLQVGRGASQKVIISVGGIDSPEVALERVSGGADLIQIYTGWVYGGPGFPRTLSQSVFQAGY